MHSKRWAAGFALVGLVVALSAGQADDKKETKKPETKPKPVLVPAGTINAQVVEVDGTTLRVRLPQAGKPYGARPQNKEGERQDDTEITLADDVRIRVPFKPELDDKGRPKAPPKKDPKDPDRNLPGVKGSTSDLTKGAHVTITLAQTRERQPKTLATLILVNEEGGRREKRDK